MANPSLNRPKNVDSAHPIDRPASEDGALVAPRRRVPTVEGLVEIARDYADNASAPNTRTAYAKDWKHFAAWCRRQGFDSARPDPRVIGLYISACAAGGAELGGPALSVSTIERRLSGLAWNFTQRGLSMDRGDRHIATVLAGIRRKHGRPPQVKEALLGDDVLAMVATLGHDLRRLRDRAILLLGFTGGLRRSEIVGLDVARDADGDSAGWIKIFSDRGVLVTVRGKTGWREVEVEVGRGSNGLSCPVVALETWIRLGGIARGPLFRRIFKDNKTVDVERLSDKHVASSAEIEERYVQKQLGHASAEMTRRYQRRRDRFRTNLTRVSGL